MGTTDEPTTTDVPTTTKEPTTTVPTTTVVTTTVQTTTVVTTTVQTTTEEQTTTASGGTDCNLADFTADDDGTCFLVVESKLNWSKVNIKVMRVGSNTCGFIQKILENQPSSLI